MRSSSEAVARTQMRAGWGDFSRTGLLTPPADLVSHWLGDRTLHGLPAWKEGMTSFFAAFPDAAYTLDDIFFAGDKGVWRGTWRATQRGEWEGIGPTGRKATWTVIIIGRFEGDRLVEDWVEYDRYNLFRQLGAV